MVDSSSSASASASSASSSASSSPPASASAASSSVAWVRILFSDPTRSWKWFRHTAGVFSMSTASWALDSLRFFIRLLVHLPIVLFTSDPMRFLPVKLAKSSKHSHSHAHAHTHHHSHHANHALQLRYPSSPQPGLSPHASTATPAPALATENQIANANASNVAAAPVALPFLSPHSFPLPSSKQPNARFYYNLDDSTTLPFPMPALPSALSSFLKSASSLVVDTTAFTLAAAFLASAASYPSSPFSSSTSSSSSSSSSAHASSGSNCMDSSSSPIGSSAHRGSGQGASSAMYQHVLKKRKKKKYTLVLDLDETLVHTTDKCIPVYDCRVEIHTKKAHRIFYILKRPFLDVFLVLLSQYFEIVIFTASIRRYADAVIDLIDVHHVVDRRFFRQSCIKNHEGSFLKDLRCISTDLRKTIIIDNSPIAYSMQESNAIPIATWYDDPCDTALRDLIPFLLALRSSDDVRALLYRRSILQRMSEAELESRGAGMQHTQQIPNTSLLIEQDEAEDESNNQQQQQQHTPNGVKLTQRLHKNMS